MICRVYFTDTPSIIVTISNNSAILENDNITLSCDVTSNPVSNITLHNMTDLSVMDTVNDGNKAEYTFLSSQCLDTGEYMFTAKNSIPDQSYVANLTSFINVMCKFEYLFNLNYLPKIL